MTSTAPWRRMILHFSHIGLTDGRTFMGPFDWSPTPRLWPPLWRPLPRRGTLLAARNTPRGAHRGMIAAAHGSAGARYGPGWRFQAAARLPSACQGVRTRGPSAAIATVNSKWAAREPSWEKI